MANTKSAKRDIKVNIRNRKRNVAAKTKMRTAVKKAITAISTQSEDQVVVLQQALKTLDKTVSKGVIHKNTAARKKSRLVKSANKACKVAA